MLRTDGWTDEPKPICPFNFSEVGGIKNKKMKQFVFLDIHVIIRNNKICRWDVNNVDPDLVQHFCANVSAYKEIQAMSYQLSPFRKN